MVCTNPITLKNPKNGKILTVPCGKCIMCRVRRTTEWANRLIMESYYWKDTSFYTFTYNEEHLPIVINGKILEQDEKLHENRYYYREGGFATLKPRDMQLFIKRLRKKDLNVKYYYCGEYGDQDGRPHYHAILYGIRPYAHQMEIEEIWGKGIAQGKTFWRERAQYTAGYIQKKLYGKEGDQGYIQTVYDALGKKIGQVHALNKDIIAPFSRMSKGIGLKFLEEYEDQIRRDEKLRFDGKELNLPRYFIKKLGIENVMTKQALKMAIDAKFSPLDALIWRTTGVVPETLETAQKRHTEVMVSRRNSLNRLYGESRGK
jgi:hypothetical protein